MNYLLGIKLSSVQSYIEESEKLMDLRNSSMIFSDIARNVIKYILTRDRNAELVYPKYKKCMPVDKIKDCTNFLLFTLSSKEVVKLEKIESYLSEVMGLHELWEEAFHLSWALETFSDNGDYAEAYHRLLQLIRGVKHTYLFHNGGQSELGFHRMDNCRICGKRLIQKDNLCCVCFHKRNYQTDNYGSASSISISIWKKKYLKDLKEIDGLLSSIFKYPEKYYSVAEVENTLTMLKNNKKNSQRYQDYLSDRLKLVYDKNKEIDVLENIKIKLKRLYDSGSDVHEPGYQYALIQFDIDSLGRWMSGEFYRGSAGELRVFQKLVSGILVEFGAALREELHQECSIIYAGGDDFLAILPLEIVFITFNQIERLFCEKVSCRLKEAEIKEEMTYSTCITIAPCKSPIGEVISKSRSELNQVKNRYEKVGKNGVVLNYLAGDRAASTVYMKRKEFQLIAELISQYRMLKDLLSLSFIKKYEKEAIGFSFQDLTLDQFEALRSINRCEFKRLMERSRLGEKEEESTLVKVFSNRLLNFLDDYFAEWVDRKTGSFNLDFRNLIGILDIFERLCRFEGRYLDEADEVKTE